jgi:hypothetical protein
MNTDVFTARARAAGPNPAPGTPKTSCQYQYVYQAWSYQSFNKPEPLAANYCLNPAILRPDADNWPGAPLSGAVAGGSAYTTSRP